MTAPLTFAELEAMTRTHVCAVPGCDGSLVLVWKRGEGVGEGSYELRCGLNKAHRGMARWRTQPKEIERRIMLESTQLMKMSEGNMLARIEMAKFPSK